MYVRLFTRLQGFIALCAEWYLYAIFIFGFNGTQRRYDAATSGPRLPHYQL
jgi:hypothetical protein